MSAVAYKQLVAKAMTEAEWQADVVRTAGQLGWWTYHPLDSRGSQSGWPDLVLIREHRIVFAELKRESGQVKPAQLVVLAMLRTVAGFVNAATGAETIAVRVWRPSDRDDVLRTLQSRT